MTFAVSKWTERKNRKAESNVIEAEFTEVDTKHDDSKGEAQNK